jgi:hypothetical protein
MDDRTPYIISLEKRKSNAGTPTQKVNDGTEDNAISHQERAPKTVQRSSLSM